MKISVITVCLNAKDAIERTFLSLINQTSSDWELIVYDGLSTDGTLDVIEKYKEHMAVFKSQKDKGVYDAMNKALGDVNGDYVIFMNAGDTFYDEKVIENTIAKIKSAQEPDFVFGYANYTDENGGFSKIHKYPNRRDKYFFVNHNICHQSIFYKKNLFKNALYDMSYKLYADWDFNAACRHKFNANFLPLKFCICNYFVDGMSSSKENSKITKKEKTAIQKKYFKNIYPFIAADKFLIKNFNTIYRPIRRLFIKEY